MGFGRTPAVVLLLTAPLCFAQDPRAIVEHAVRAWDRNDQLMIDYTYKVRNEVRELDSAGRAKSDHSTLDEVLYIGGKRYFRPIEKDGEPLSPAREKSEEAKLERAAREAGRLSEAEHERRIEDAERDRLKRREQFRDIPEAYDFEADGRDADRGPRHLGDPCHAEARLSREVWQSVPEYRRQAVDRRTGLRMDKSGGRGSGQLLARLVSGAGQQGHAHFFRDDPCER